MIRRLRYLIVLVLLGAASLLLASTPAAVGTLFVKEGNLTASRATEFSGPVYVAVASDPRHGPLIAVLDGSGNVWVKEGSLTATWTEECAGGATFVAVASDAKHGPLIAARVGTDVWAKEGSAIAAWTNEYSGLSVGATPVAVGSDPTNGPVIGLAEAAA